MDNSPFTTRKSRNLPRWVMPLAVTFIASAAAATGGERAATPRLHLHRECLDTAYVQPTGRTITTHAGDDFQNALERAARGDVIALEAGAVFRGPFILPAKEGDGWITIRTVAPDDRLPPEGTRIDPGICLQP